MTYRQQGRPHIRMWVGEDQSQILDLSRDCVSFSCSKTLDQPTGKWSVTVVPRTSDTHITAADIRRAVLLYERIQTNNLISIGFQQAGGIMFGLVKNVRLTRQLLGKKKVRGLVISGLDFGAALVEDSVVKASVSAPDMDKFEAELVAALGPKTPILKTLPGTWGPLSKVKADQELGVRVFSTQTVADVVAWILEEAMSLRVPLLERANSFSNVAKYITTENSITTWNDGRLWGDAISNFQGSIWNFLNATIDRDFYEIVLHTVPPRTSGSGSGILTLPGLDLVIRPKPYDDAQSEASYGLKVAEDPGITWDSLRTHLDGLEYHEIPEDSVLSESLGVSADDAFGMYVVTAQHELVGNPQNFAEGLYFPCVDTYIVKRFGLKQYSARLALVAGDLAEKAAGTIDYDRDVAPVVVEFRNRLVNWYRMNPWYETGSVKVPGNDRYRPGDKVRLPYRRGRLSGELGLDFYMTGCTWAWSYGAHYTSELTLTRGHNKGEIRRVGEIILADAPAGSPRHFAETGNALAVAARNA